MLKIDSHQHFWKFDPVRDCWITDEMASIRQDFLPSHLKPLLDHNNIDGCVAVQSDQSESENDFQLANASENDFIKGVVGWVDLQSEIIEARLEYYSQFNKMKGFRHVLQGEPQRDFMLRPAFRNGISLLKKYNFTYDLLLYPDQLAYSKQLVAAFADQLFVIDHIAKPAIRDKKITDWKRDITAIASHQNVYCKLSGMVTEADWKRWTPSDFTPYLDIVVDAFGVDRIMFGSDWPVCLVAASYDKTLSSMQEYFSSFSHYERDLFFGGNAIKFYNLK